MGDDIFELVTDKSNENCFICCESDFVNLTKADIYSELEKYGIVTGIDEDKIDNLLLGEYVGSTKEIIASFIRPRKGKKQSLKFLIDTERDLKQDSSGNIDFYAAGTVKTVLAEEKLVEIIPPTKGMCGRNVFGKEIPGILGDDIELFPFIGEGVILSADKKFIIAERDGVYNVSHKKEVSVLDEVIIKGNLDFKTGNIDTNANVKIAKDIKSGFSCKSTGSILVKGVIEDSEIYTASSLICKMGILHGDLPIEVENKLRVKYIRDRTELTCYDLFVEEMISGSYLKVENILEANIISGGAISVKRSIKVKQLGNMHNIPTVIELGIDNKLFDKVLELKKKIEIMIENADLQNKEKQKLEKEHIELSEQIWQISSDKSKFELLEVLAIKAKMITDSITEITTNLTNSDRDLKFKKKMLAKFEREIDELDTEFEVSGKVYPNVLIKIKRSIPYVVKSILENVIFKYSVEDQKVIIMER